MFVTSSFTLFTFNFSFLTGDSHEVEEFLIVIFHFSFLLFNF
jgi:hypothetical protein